MPVDIFLQDVTLLDNAFLFPKLGIVGKSFFVDVGFEGETDNKGFLFDFSQAKKLTKTLLDQEYDHKLLLAPEYIRSMDHTQVIVGAVTPDNFFALQTFPTAIGKLNLKIIADIEQNLFTSFADKLATEIHRHCPSNISKVHVLLKESNYPQETGAHFQYLHSLCQHSGNCQRFHGHSGFVKVLRADKSLDSQLTNKISQFLNQKYLVSGKHVVSGNHQIISLTSHFPELETFSGQLTQIQHTGSQGQVTVICNREHVHYLQDESTIENIVQWIHTHFKIPNDREIYIFEGFCKGARWKK